jgi:hypothetical protein
VWSGYCCPLKWRRRESSRCPLVHVKLVIRSLVHGMPLYMMVKCKWWGGSLGIVSIRHQQVGFLFKTKYVFKAILSPCYGPDTVQRYIPGEPGGEGGGSIFPLLLLFPLPGFKFPTRIGGCGDGCFVACFEDFFCFCFPPCCRLTSLVPPVAFSELLML